MKYGLKYESTFSARYWSKVIRKGDDECWDWSGCKTPQGYGRFSRDQRGGMVYAHRVALEMVGTVVPSDLCVLHSCDNPSCCNPKHLRLGNRRDNARDMFARPQGKPAHGTRRAKWKMAASQVRSVRGSLAAGKSHEDIAAEHGVGKACISNISSGRTWRWLD